MYTHQVDQNIRSYFALKAADRWLSVRLELLGAVVVACGAILSVQGASVVSSIDRLDGWMDR